MRIRALFRLDPTLGRRRLGVGLVAIPSRLLLVDRRLPACTLQPSFNLGVQPRDLGLHLLKVFFFFLPCCGGLPRTSTQSHQVACGFVNLFRIVAKAQCGRGPRLGCIALATTEPVFGVSDVSTTKRVEGGRSAYLEMKSSVIPEDRNWVIRPHESGSRKCKGGSSSSSSSTTVTHPLFVLPRR